MPKLNVDIGVDGTRLVRGLKSSESAVAQWSNSVKGYIAGAFSVGAIAAAMSQTAGYFDNVGNAAERLDIGVESMQTLVMMAKLAGKELGNVEQMMTAIADAQIAAIEDPSSKQAEAFAKMGLSPQMLNQMGLSDLTQTLAQANQGLTGSQIRSNMTDIVGKKGVGMFASMLDDLANLSGMIEDFKSQGAILSEDELSQMKRQLDQWDFQKTKLMATLTKDFLPALTFFARALQGVVIFIKTIFSSFGAFFGRLFSGVSKGKGWAGFVDDIKESAALFADEWLNAGEEYVKSGQMLAAIKGGVGEPETGPGIPVGTDKPTKDKASAKAERTDFMKGFEPYKPEQYSGPQLPMSNFLGSNLGLIQNASAQTLSVLNKIEANTKELVRRQSAQSTSDMLYSLFGVVY
jgi:hypothetical protein